MKMLACLALMALSASAFPQSDTLSVNGYIKIAAYDLSRVINADSIIDDEGGMHPRGEILGFIDTTYQRLHINFTTFTKDPTNPYVYRVKGKTRVRENVCDFEGTMRVVKARIWKDVDYIDLPDWSLGFVVCDVKLFENKNQSGSGTIEGRLTTNFVIESPTQMRYDALWSVADGFCNNQFKGKWTSYKTNRSKPCHWGDYRIPDSGPLDVGSGEFSPREKFLARGWKSYRP